MNELIWSFDRAPPVNRWHSRVGDFDLYAYEDGRWVVRSSTRDRRYFAEGIGELGLDNAKRRAQTVWEVMR